MDRRQDHAALLQRSLDRHHQRLSHDLDLRRSAPVPEAIARLAQDGRSTIASIALACSLYAERPAFAERAFELTDEGALRRLPRFATTSYAEVWERVQAFASGLHHAGLSAPGDRVAISGFAGVDWVIADFACVYLAAVSVPLQAGMPAADLQQILGETAPRAVVCSAAHLDVIAAALPGCPDIRSIVVMDHEPRDRARTEAVAARMEALRATHGARLVVLTMEEVARIGRQEGLLPAADPAEARAEADPLMTILYTSGSTGTPKGAMFPESLLREQWRTPIMDRLPPIAHLNLCYMPLNHAAGRYEVMHGILRGGLTSFAAASDMSTLFEDIRLARPTRLMLVPRVSSLIHQHFQAEAVRRAAGAAPEPRAQVEAEILAEMRRGFLGDRLVYALAGTAPTAAEIIEFLERCFDVPILDGYGSTEAGMISFDGKIVGDEVTAYKIVDVPDLGYRRSDKPHPRGELCVQTKRMVPGYYKNEAATKELYDEEGWLHTGDIVALRGDGEIAWLDRKKNVLKLAQGEYVSTARLEGLYAARSPFISQLYVHGSSLRAYLLAVVVPDARAVTARLGEGAGEGAVKQLLRDEIDRVARAEGLPSWEVPREILIEASPFTRENGLLTASNKPARPQLAARYGEQLEALYTAIERAQVEKLHALEGTEGDGSTAEQAALAVEIALGVADVDPARSFVALGGDSIAAVRLASLLSTRFAVDVPVGLILDPTSSVASLSRYIEDHLSGGARGVSFAGVHGAGATVVKASDLRLDRVLVPIDEGAAAPLAGEVRVAFLTGASGFLGRFLLLDLLERLPRGGKVVCVVRARDDDEARGRLSAVYRSDPALAQRFQDLVTGRLETLAGDLMKPRFGLSEATFERLAGEVDAVIHSGALVNHALSYRELFEPNVLGTAEAIRLATQRRLKALTYVSTVGVAGGIDRRDPVREDEEAAALFPERPIDGGYAGGYATSKWAGEILVREAADRFDLPVAVTRCSMIMPHRCYAGQVNAGDFVTRLFAGIIATGVAPRSFYASPGGHHFDGLPVDFVAGAIASIAARPEPGFAQYHVTNPHTGDGVSLDTFADWMETAGYAVKRIDDYARWYATFAAQLAALPAAERQRSPLSIVTQWEKPSRGDLHFDTSRLKQRLGIEIPFLTERYLHKYLRDMVALHLVDPPGRKHDTAA